MVGKRLPAAFFARDTVTVARELLGCVLVHEEASVAARIVETEAYTEDDPACHAYANGLRRLQGKPVTGRSALLYGPPGVAYVYLNYGIHWLFNIVTEPKGQAGAVLIRAVEPIYGEAAIRKRRPVARPVDMTNGPGKVTAALGIDHSHNGLSLFRGGLYIAKNKEDWSGEIACSSRIGISKGQERPWRFFIAGNQFVSPARPS